MMSFSNVKLDEIFPTTWSLLVFLAYMTLFINQGLLIKASQNNDNSYNYSVTSVILCSELLKLFICISVFLKDKQLSQLVSEMKSGFRICVLYMIPAFLYCLYNNLSFVNLANYDPTTYFILLQFRNVVTGVFFQILFKKKLTFLQWISLAILTLGCIIKELGRINSEKETASFSPYSLISFNLLLIIVQILCSCFAGVYNEYLLKDTGASVHILIHNIFMYCDSFICNFILLFATTPMSSINFDFSFLSQPLIICILVNGAFAGITTSFFLKSLNSILKTFAATLEIVFTAILCYFIFGIPIDTFTIVSIMLIFLALYVYSQKPVVNNSSTTNSIKLPSNSNEDEEHLINN